MPPNPNKPQGPKQFKSQPWILFDTVAAYSFLCGDTSSSGLAIGAQNPAVSANGEIVFFNSAGRTTANYPWYTNLDTTSQLAYGMEVWQMYCSIVVPAFPMVPSYDPAAPGTAPTLLIPPPTTRLVEAIIGFGVLDLDLGQENQTRWPLSRFGAGGGVADAASSVSLPTNARQETHNVLKLAEPIEMPRTQNLSAKIRLAAEVLPVIGNTTTKGVGAPLKAAAYTVAASTTVNITLPPYAIQLGLVGRRVKKTQYGQIPAGG